VNLLKRIFLVGFIPYSALMISLQFGVFVVFLWGLLGSDMNHGFSFSLLSSEQLYSIFTFAAFIVFGTIEESVKFLLARRYRIPNNPLVYRYTILYIVSGTLGLSLMQNIGYSYMFRDDFGKMTLFAVVSSLLFTPLQLLTGALIGIEMVKRDFLAGCRSAFCVLKIPILFHGIAAFQAFFIYSLPLFTPKVFCMKSNCISVADIVSISVGLLLLIALFAWVRKSYYNLESIIAGEMNIKGYNYIPGKLRQSM